MKASKMSDIGQICPDVLKAYLGDYSLKLSASEIAKEIKTERRTVSRVLNKLVDYNLMNYVVHGKNKLFYLDLKKESSKILIDVAEQTKTLDFCLNTPKIIPIAQELIDISDTIVIFGSYASGKFSRNSDLDILIFGSDKESINEVVRKFSTEINYHLSTYKDFEKSLSKNALAIEIKSNHIIFGNTRKLTEIFGGYNG